MIPWDDFIIITGMGHSGTSLITSIMEEAGIWMVPDMDHHETRAFTLAINDRLLDGRWYKKPIFDIDSLNSLWPKFEKIVNEKTARLLSENGYQGGPWAAKDPRFSILLPLYLRIAPGASIVHIVRSHDAVADSLLRSHHNEIPDMKRKEFWVDLRRQYVNRVRDFGPRFEGKYVEVNYEAVCLSPHDTMKGLLYSLDLPVTDGVVRKCGGIYKRRVFV